MMIIEYSKFNFIIEALDALALPYYKGSTFRGAFGYAFRRVVCALKRNDCTDCFLKSKCIYAYVFETSPSADASMMHMNKYLKIPHPFIIEPPEAAKNIFNPGEQLSFNLILIGRASDYLPYFIYTFDELGKSGIGKRKGRYRLLRVDNDSGKVYSAQDKVIRDTAVKKLEIPEDIDFNSDINHNDTEKSSSITLRFITPVRISYGRDLAVKLEFHILIRALLRRLCLLQYFHSTMREPAWDHKKIILEAENVVIESDNLRWYDWERYSTRQAVRMKLGGLVGDIKYRGDIEPFIHILKAGDILHVGKGTSFGLGKYAINK